MIVCPNCNRQNEDHYKFCLGCGTELTAVARTEAPKAEAKPAMAKPAAVARPMGLPPVGGGGLGSPRTALPTPTPMPAVAGPVPAPTALPTPSPLRATAGPDEATSAVVAVGADDTRPTPGVVVGSFGTDDDAPRVTVRRTTGQEVRGLRSADADSSVERVDTAADEGEPEGATVAESLPSLPEPVPTPPGLTPPPTESLGAESAPVSPVAARAVPMAASAPPVAAAARIVDLSPRLEGRRCRTCSAAVPDGFKFCGECGSRYEGPSKAPTTEPIPTDVENPARLVLIHPDGSPGESFPLTAGETVVGRQHESPLFRNDPFLSPRHATFFFVRGQLFVRDEASLNGVFIRIKAEVELFHRDMFRIGQQLLRFEEMGQVRPLSGGAGDGTTVLGSPVRGAWGRLCSAVAIDTTASVWILRRPEEQLGRERGEVQFPDDGFVSGGHCKLVTRDGRFFLRDIGSTNGTYLRIKGEGFLAQGDLVLLGQQLFKIDLTA